MRIGSEFETVNVVLNGAYFYPLQLRLLSQKYRIVHSLRSGSDLLPSHEEIEGVGEPAVVLARHGVERSCVRRVPMQEVKIGVVLLPHNGSQLPLDVCAQIIVQVLLDAFLLEQVDSLLEGQFDDGVLELERREVVLLVDGLQFLLELEFDLTEDVAEHLRHDVHQFVVVLVDDHLQIQTCELAHVPVGEGVLRPENRAHFEHPFEVGHHEHLFVELWGLSEAGLLVEVVQFEDVGPALAGPSDQFWRVDLHEVVFVTELSEELAHSGRETENGLFAGGSQVDDPVIQSGLHAHFGLLGGVHSLIGFLFLFQVVLFIFSYFQISLVDLSARVVYLEWQEIMRP